MNQALQSMRMAWTRRACRVVACAMIGGTMAAWPADAQPSGGDGEPQAQQVERGGERGDRDRGRRGGPWRGWVEAHELTEDQIDTLLEIVEAVRPDRIEQYRALREQDEPKLRESLARIANSMGDAPMLMRMKSWDREMYDLQIAYKAAEFRVARTEWGLRRVMSDEDRDDQRVEELTGELEVAIRERRQAYIAIQELQIKRFEQRLAELRARLDESKARLSENVTEELAERVRRAEAGERPPRIEDEQGPGGFGGPGRPGGPGRGDGGERGER